MKSLKALLLLLLVPALSWGAGNEPFNPVPNVPWTVLSPELVRQWQLKEGPSVFSKYFHSDFVVSGGLHVISATCISPAFSVSAFTSAGNHVTATGIAIDYCSPPISASASDSCDVIASAATPSGTDYKQVPGTNIYVNCTAVDTALPPDSAMLMRTTISSSAITAIRDLRKPSSFAVQGVYDITDPLYGAVSGQDSTAAIRSAINAQSGNIVRIPSGIYTISSKITIDTPHTVRIIGDSNSSVFKRSPSMSEDMFLVRTGGVDFYSIFFYDDGTDCTRLGGAIYMTGLSLTDRAGFSRLDNIRISSTAACGIWEYGIYINGSNLRVPGTAGVRDIIINNSYFFGVRTPGKTIFMDTCVNCFISNVGIFGAPTAIIQGVWIQGWDGVTNWSDSIYISNSEVLGNFYVEGNNVSYVGGRVGNAAATPTISIPATSTNVYISALTVPAANISNLGFNTIVAQNQPAAGSSTTHSTFPTGTGAIEGLTIVGSVNTPDYQGITRIAGNKVSGNPLARLMSGVLGSGSTWEFGISNDYGLGVNLHPVVIDRFGIQATAGFGMRFEGILQVNLPNLAINGMITYCTDCTELDPCTGGGAGAFAQRIAARWKCN